MKISIDQAFQKGVEAHTAGKLKEAEHIYRAILKIHPSHIAAHSNLGIMLYELGRLEEAELGYKKLIKQKPNYAEAHCNLGVIQHELNRLKEAEVSYKKAIKLKPKYITAHNNLGNTLKKIGRLEEAEKSYKTAIMIKPDYVEAHYNLGVMLQEIDRLDEAEICCKKTIKIKPDYAEVYNNLGIILQKLGRIGDAEKKYKKAIDIKPKYVEAHFNLSQIKVFKKKDKQLLQIQNLYLDKRLTNEQSCNIGFALGKAYEDLNQLNQSFRYYSEGNAFRKKSLIYNIHQDVEVFNQLKNTYPSIKKNSLKINILPSEPRPIFVLGMPRSGTTLIEQIISAHSEVKGAGELSYVEQFGDTLARGTSKINTKILLDFRKNYLQKLQELSNGSLIVIDKMTINFRYIGLICSAFPNVKIVHVKRDPAATCWGNYKQLFSNKESFHYSYYLDDVITYYKLYQDLMQFWKKQFGEQIYDINYEALTTNQEDETKKLIKYLELKWEEKCLAPQNNDRIVVTASSKQVRQKVYQGSSKNWKKFEPYLNGIFNNFYN